MLFLNKRLFEFGKYSSPRHYFRKRQNKNVIHLFSKYDKENSLWTEITHYISKSERLIHATPLITFSGYFHKNDKNFSIPKLVLVVFKFYVYKSGKQHAKFE